MNPPVYEIIGYINKVTKKATLVGEYGKKEVVPAEFSVQTTEAPYKCICPFFIPIEEGDIIKGKICIISNTPTLLLFKQEPLIQIPTDEANVKQCFVRALRTTGFGGVSADRLYDGLMNMARINHSLKNVMSLDDIVAETKTEVNAFMPDDPTAYLQKALPGFKVSSTKKEFTSNDVIAYLTEWSVKYVKTNDRSICENIAHECNLKNGQVACLLQWWHKERLIRKLRLLGLTNDEIKACHLPLDDIYRICIGDTEKAGNPFRLAPIPMEKCMAIMKFLGVAPSPTEITCGQIVRKIYESQTSFGWTCTPVWVLQRQFNNFHIYRQFIVQDYDVTIEYECAYLKYPYIVESEVAGYVDDLIKTTAEKLNEVCTIDLPHFESAIYTCKTLTQEQKIAIQAALQHDICVITGGSGTGKCLAPETPVLMFDGRIKMAQHVIKGDKLMGPDSMEKNVLGTTVGVGRMYKIEPKEGTPFVCNSKHILTLVGREPIITQVNDEWSVIYTHQGILQESFFAALAGAQLFIRLLKPDVFDISLQDYVMLPEGTKNNMYLFHQSVEFPEQELIVGPYLTGLSYAQLKKGCIPYEYKCNIQNNRLMFLAGFIDGMWQSSKNTHYILDIPDKQLCDDITYIAYSVGFMVVKDEFLHIKGIGLDLIPTVLSRLPSLNKTRRNETHQPFIVKDFKVSQFNGFQLDGDGRFLLGDFTVSHNSTIIGEIVKNLTLRECTFAIGSPTGKAASRVNEIVPGKTAQTLDRMIMKSIGQKFSYLIIDETSMVTTELFYRFIKAFPHNFRIVIIGDINQLQPIGWGSFMKHLLISKRVPTYYLNYNHRIELNVTTEQEFKRPKEEMAPGLEKFDRLILDNANRLIDPDRKLGEPLFFNQGKGFSIIEGGIGYIETIVRALHKSGVKCDKITILSPFNQFINELNEIFRRVYFPDARPIMCPNKILWYPGARAMMLYNNYDINVMNGEEGTVMDVDNRGVSVKFKDGAVHLFKFQSETATWKTRTYKNLTEEGESVAATTDEEKGELLSEHIQISFAISVHKSQGSEVEYINLYIPTRYGNGNGKMTMNATFLNINLLYTGITRTKKACWIVGDENALMQATTRAQPRRYENLSARLLAVKDAEKEVKIHTINEITKTSEVVEEEYDELPPDEDDSMYAQHYQD